MTTHEDPHNDAHHEEENETDRHQNASATSNASSTAASVKSVYIFRNGDTFAPCKKMVVNNRQVRSWDIFLDHVTLSVNPLRGAVRNIVTPKRGHRVRSLEEMSDKGLYVALSHGERFSSINYGEPVKQGEKSTSPTTPRKNVIRLEPILPVVHSKHYAVNSSSKINEEMQKRSKTIRVYRNGDEFTPSVIVLLKPHEQKSMEMVYRAIEERVVLPNNRAIRKLYTLAGVKVFQPHQLEDGVFYVAAGLELFISRPYGQQLPALIVGKAERKNHIRYLNNPVTPAKTSRQENEETSRQQKDTSRSQKQQQQQQQQGHTNRDKKAARKPPPDDATKQKAASTIQASFNGYKTRKEIVEKKSNSKFPIKHETQNRSNQKSTKPTKSQPKKQQPQKKPAPSQQEKDKAASSIQASYRGYQTRKSVVEKQNSKPLPIRHENKAANKQKPQTKSNQKSQAEKDKAATTIQASYKGYQTRKSVVEKQNNKPLPIKHDQSKSNSNKQENKTKQGTQNRQATSNKQENQQKSQQNKQEKTPTSNTDKNKAATTIQSSYKGYKTRKDITQKTQEKEKAATTIQAGYKGYKTRNETGAGKQGQEKKDDKTEASKNINASLESYKARKEVANRQAGKR